MCILVIMGWMSDRLAHGLLPSCLALAALWTPGVGCKSSVAQDPGGRSPHAVDFATTTLTSATVDVPPAPSRPPALEGVFTLGGLRYVEVVSGGALADDRLPMIVLLHGMGLRPRMFAALLGSFPLRARFILPYGYLPAGQGFAWFPARTAALAPGAQLDAALPAVADQVASALLAIRGARPTLGKMMVGGFSQGAELSYGLALLHPEMFLRACVMSGALTGELLQRPRADGPKPEVHGFHGADDLIIRTAAGQQTIAGFSALGYVADMKVYPGAGHSFPAGVDDVRACLPAGARSALAAP